MENFVNNQVHLDDLPSWEEVIFAKVSKKYRYVVILNYIVFSIVVLGGAVFIAWVKEIQDYRTYLAICGTGLAFMTVLCLLHLWSCSYWGYALRDRDILFKSGIFSRRVEIVPYRHIQHVNVKEGFFSRLFSLASIEVFTAGSGKSIRIPGIAQQDSAPIQEYISNRISDKQID